MILLVHISIALLGLISATFAFFAPSRLRLQVSGVLTVLTLASGTYLVVSTHAPMMQACLSGIFYLGTVLSLIILAFNKLAKDENTSD